MRKTIDWLLLVGLLGGVGFAAYTHQGQLRGLVHDVQSQVAPCSAPVTYSIGSVDPRFGISDAILINDLKDAQSIWETPSGKHLFQYVQNGGDVTVNLVYDSRQAATDQLRAAGISLDTSQSSYDSLKAHYDTLDAQVATEQSAYQQAASQYKQDEAAYNAKVEQWNGNGGAPPAVYAQLQQQKSALQSEFDALKVRETALNGDIDTLNALATALNQLIVQLNLNVQQYNSAGAGAGEFEEGLYQDNGGVRTIDIYEYSDHAQLVRVLAHELGHALGLDHVADPSAIMYKINNGDALQATAADIAELDRVCSARPL